MKSYPAMNEMVNQWTETLFHACKTATERQSEVVDWWFRACQTATSRERLMEKGKALAAGLAQITQANSTDWVSAVGEGQRQFWAQLHRGIELVRCRTLPETQAKLTELWQASEAAARQNALTLIRVNARLARAGWEIWDPQTAEDKN